MGTTNKELGYIGFEPSGKPHIGIIPILESISMPVILFVANIHAKLNGKTIYEGFAEDLMDLASKLNLDYQVHVADEGYLASIAMLELKVSQLLTTNRVQKALTITGKESKGSEKIGILRYITLQITDPFFLGVDHIYSGSDQRSCSVLSVEVGKKLDHPITFDTTPLLLNTRAKSITDSKMSKSKPETCIFLKDEELEGKIKAATDFWVEHACNAFKVEYVDYKKGRINLIERLKSLQL